jgi:hypothetical protein
VEGTEQVENPLIDLEKSRAARQQHEQIVKWTLEKFQAMKSARVNTERQWYYNLLFMQGRQNVLLLKDYTAGINNSIRMYVPPAPPWRMRMVINRIRPTIRTELAQLTNNKPNAYIVPASAEDRDMYAAMAGEQIWENLYTEHKVKSVIRKAMWWNLVCGNGYIKNYWDFQRDDMVFAHETPFHVLIPDLREEEIENQPYLFHAQLKSPEYVQMYYQQMKIKPSSLDAQDLLDESYLNLTGANTLNRQQQVLCLEVWVKPGMHPMFPEGAFYHLIGDKIVQARTGLPFKHGKYPFAKFDHIPSGKYYTVSSIEDLISLQKEYNRTRSQIVEAKNRMAKPQLIAPRGSVDASKITTEPGQVIFYTPGFQPPTPLPLQALPNYVIQETDRILMDWKDISGQHEVSQGQIPPGVTAATAISFLQERDESKLSPTFDSLEEGIEKIAGMALSYVHEYWDVERTVKVTGPDGSFDAMAFKGSDLGNNVDIKIEAGSALPVSKAAKQALIMDMMKMGFIDPQKGLEVMDMGGINKIYEQLQVDQRQAQRENLRMSKVTEEILNQYNLQNVQMREQALAAGQPSPFGEMTDPLTGEVQELMPPIIVPVNSWDNHKAHIEYHNRFRKGQAFEQLPPFAKDLIEEHVQQHIEALGMETITQEPRQAAGLPPIPLDSEGEETDDSGASGAPVDEINNTPGPEPMPEGIE